MNLDRTKSHHSGESGRAHIFTCIQPLPGNPMMMIGITDIAAVVKVRSMNPTGSIGMKQRSPTVPVVAMLHKDVLEVFN